ncbi:Short-chain dehydrogenase/reductase SDR [Macrophomina phaseolina MS6]|uniref:Short-chain dehydrogenase/reductase SDR n=1 Tax=Macrophomina phaseolina (strain MS6) TaxID=1126212 RepID=K2R8C2_MACPH|nr:Short-chain dehydrogenase/reductase SDR [Macrophomina phaseolina MS6]
MFDTNVFGLFDMVSVFTPLLLAAASDSHHPPTIINVASILARLPYAFSAAYNASKAAVSSYSDTLRLELAPLGIKVVTLFMGEVSTGLMSADNISFGSDSLYAGVEERVKERSKQHAKSSVKPEEFAKRVVDHVLVKKPQIGTGEHLWEGSNASTIWALDAVGHRKIFDGVVKGAVGLNKPEVVKSILDKAESKVKRGA